MIWQFMKFPLNCHGKIPEKKVACSRNVETIPYNYFVYIVHAASACVWDASQRYAVGGGMKL